jgi:hypothetical protein
MTDTVQIICYRFSLFGATFVTISGIRRKFALAAVTQHLSQYLDFIHFKYVLAFGQLRCSVPRLLPTRFQGRGFAARSSQQRLGIQALRSAFPCVRELKLYF